MMVAMDLSFPPDAEDFRAEIREWLEANLPDGWFEPGFEMSDAARKRFNLEWPAKLFEGGWICATWPEEYGGKGLTTMQGVVLAEEFARARAPMRGDFFGDTLVGPTLLQWGSEEQKQEFLPGILQGRTRWCQGFSEPDSGSDLASLKTTAVLDGDEWVINGQKVWTTLAHSAQWCFAIVRTDPDVPPHKGLSYVLVPMDQPGVDIRPLKQMTGTAEFNEVFFDDARTPVDLVVGDVNDGWKVAMATLGFERGTAFLSQQLGFQRELSELIQLAQKNGAVDEAAIRQRLADAYVGVQIMKYNGMRMLTSLVKKGVLGPEASVGKLFWSSWHRALGELAMDVLGAESQIVVGGHGSDYELNELQRTFMFSRSETIYAGSSEIQKNIIGERVLGLPREPR